MCSGMSGMPIVLWSNKLPISLERVAVLVKLAQKCPEINQQNGFWKKPDQSMSALLGVKWCTIIAFVGENVFG